MGYLPWCSGIGEMWKGVWGVGGSGVGLLSIKGRCCCGGVWVVVVDAGWVVVVVDVEWSLLPVMSDGIGALAAHTSLVVDDGAVIWVWLFSHVSRPWLLLVPG